jgi:hypothetical protein
MTSNTGMADATVASEAMLAPSDAAKASFFRGFNMIISPL